MKDLKHLIYFENLLQQADNELVEQGRKDGKLALGYTCYFVPETLLNLPGCFSTRLRAPNTGSIDVGTYYMTNKICSYTRSILERGIEGGYNYLDALLSSETCQMMHRGHEHFELLGLVKNNPKFFMSMMDVPFSDSDNAVDHYEDQIKTKLLQPLHDVYGVDISDDAVRKAIEDHNEISAIITEIGDLRKLPNPPITGYEFHVLTLATYACPKRLVLDKLQETLEEVKRRVPDTDKKYRARVMVIGSEIDDPGLIKLIEDTGALVVADRFCFGSIPGRQEIPLTDGEDALTQVIRFNLKSTQCPRQCAQHRVQNRWDTAARLMKEYSADGAIYEQMKFCTYWSYERAMAGYIMPREYGMHVLSIDRPYIAGQSGQLRTRVQAFIESLEIKKINEGKGEAK